VVAVSFYGLAVELTEALAEYWHRKMASELGIDTPKRAGGPRAGVRYGIGYPSCPDLELQHTLFSLIQPETIGVSLTEALQMNPEFSTSAIFVHHPQARYFSV
jgi:5-methyltetrahydrofolate--homocysteine methyltransferase